MIFKKGGVFLLDNLLYRSSSVHITGNSEIFIENCKRIEEYNEIFIKLRTNELFLQIWGTNMKAYDFKTSGLIIKGKISQIEFIEKR